MNMPSERELIDVEVVDVRRAPSPTRVEARHVVVLEEASGGRRLPIWMGDREATQIAVLHEGLELPRPMTVQFMAELLRTADVEVVEVVNNRLAWGTFYATVVISGSAGRRHVEGRPSDAIALALAVDAPVLVAPLRSPLPLAGFDRPRLPRLRPCPLWRVSARPCNPAALG